MIPLFPELRHYLQEHFDQPGGGAEFVIDKLRVSSSYFSKRIKQFIRSAGLEPWPKLFQNMRSTRQTELAAEFPAHVACEWIGNSEKIAQQHYLQTTDEHFEKAAGSSAAYALQQATETGCNVHQAKKSKPLYLQGFRGIVHFPKML